MARLARADAVSRANLMRPPPRFGSRHARECDVVWGYEPILIDDAVARGQDAYLHGICAKRPPQQSYSVHCTNMLLARVHKPGRPHKVVEDFFTTLQTLWILEVGKLETWMADSSFVTCAAGDDKDACHGWNRLAETG